MDPAANRDMFANALAEAAARGGGVVEYGQPYTVAAPGFTIRDQTWLFGNRQLLTFASGAAGYLSGAGIGLDRVRATAGAGSFACFGAEGTLIEDFTCFGCEMFGRSQADAPFALLRFQPGALRRCSVMTSSFHTGVAGVHFNDASAADIALEDISILGNQFRWLLGDGVGVNSPGTLGLGAKRVSVIGNSFYRMFNMTGGAAFAVMDFAGTTQLVIIGNHIDDWQALGLWFEDDCRDVLIHANTFENQDVTHGMASNNVQSVINVLRAQQFTISDNIIRNCNTQQLLINCSIDQYGGSPGCWLINNRAWDCPNVGSIWNLSIGFQVLNDSNGWSEVRGNVLSNAGGISFDAQRGKISGNVVEQSALGYYIGVAYGSSGTVGKVDDNTTRDVAERVRPRNPGFRFLETSATAHVTGLTPVDGYIGWIDVMELGAALWGQLMVNVTSAAAEAVLLADVFWDGTSFTNTAHWTSANGELSAVELQASNGRLQVRAACSGSAMTGITVRQVYGGVIHGAA